MEYESPRIEIVRLDENDFVTTSNELPEIDNPFEL
jgi:hypothetical protein